MIVLKQNLGEAGALVGDKSIGVDTLYDVLKAQIQGGTPLTAYQATIATATLNGIVLDKPHKLTNLRTAVAVCGTANSTTVQVHKNGVSQGELTTANDDADGTKSSLDLDVDCVAGDLIQLVVSAAPTGGTGLTATAKLEPVDVE
jgi:hypothetical protein